MADAPQSVAVTPDGKIAQDLRCSVCGYNLRGLDPAGACPECNSPVWRSTYGDLLRFADPEWLEKLRLGISVMLWTIIVAILGGIVIGLLLGVGLPLVVVALFALATDGLGLWAAFLITTQEPRISLEEDPVTLRKVVRGCAVLTFTGEIVNQAGEFATGGVLLVAIGTTLQLAVVVSYFGEFMFLRRFARRIPDEGLAKSTTTVMWGVVIAMAIALVGSFIAAVVGGATGATGGGAFAAGALIVGCPVLIAGVVFLLMYIRLLVRYRDAFAAAAAESGQASVQPATLPEADTGPTRFT